MSQELLTVLAAVSAALLGGGGTYAVQRIRNGTTPTGHLTESGQQAIQDAVISKAECSANHQALAQQQARVEAQLERGSKKMDALRETVTDLTVEIRTGLERLKVQAAEAGRDEAVKELDAHRRRDHA